MRDETRNRSITSCFGHFCSNAFFFLTIWHWRHPPTLTKSHRHPPWTKPPSTPSHLTSSMVQSFNLSAIINAFRLFVQPSLAVPHLVVTGNLCFILIIVIIFKCLLQPNLPTSLIDIRHINFSSLKSSGFRAVAFDKDNCLTAPYQSKVYPPFQVCNRIYIPCLYHLLIHNLQTS